MALVPVILSTPSRTGVAPPPEPEGPFLPGSATNLLYEALAPLSAQDEELGWPLLYYCDAICNMINFINDIIRDSPDGPGWHSIMDPDTAPTEALSWLGQFVGVIVPPQALNQTEEQWEEFARFKIKSVEGFRRGSARAFASVAAPFLIGQKELLIYERDTSPYHLTVYTYDDETLDESAVLAALLSQKPAGLVMDYQTIARNSYAAVDVSYSTYTAVDVDYTSYAGLQSGQIGS